MSEILFQPRAPIAPRHPNRADIALFVGTVARRRGASVDPGSARARTADELYAWLAAEGWTVAANRRDQRPLEELLDVPVPIERWADFERLFDWRARELLPGIVGSTYLGAAVSSFFAEGGRRCYVVRVGDPWPVSAGRVERDELLERLVPTLGQLPAGSAVDRRTWRGVWHLHGLPDVSFVCIPELPEVVADPPPPLPLLPPPKVREEIFVECSEPAPAPVSSFARSVPAPRCNEAGYGRWAKVVGILLDALTRASATSSLREVQLVSAIPLPNAEMAAAHTDLLSFLRDDLGLDRDRVAGGLASSFLQLVYPWLLTSSAPELPEGLEGPEAVLLGLLAQNALGRGSFRSAAGSVCHSVLGVEPRLSALATVVRLQVLRRLGSLEAEPALQPLDDADELAGVPSAASIGPELVTPAENLVRRVSLFGRTPAGFRLLSDVTTSKNPSYRQAQLGRLVVAILRAARLAGEEDLFEASGPALWASLRSRLSSVLSGLWQAGALRGAREQDAYQVRCDRSTMSEDDLERGRVIAEVTFDAVTAIDRITVSFVQGTGPGLGLAERDS